MKKLPVLGSFVMLVIVILMFSTFASASFYATVSPFGAAIAGAQVASNSSSGGSGGGGTAVSPTLSNLVTFSNEDAILTQDASGNDVWEITFNVDSTYDYFGVTYEVNFYDSSGGSTGSVTISGGPSGAGLDIISGINYVLLSPSAAVNDDTAVVKVYDNSGGYLGESVVINLQVANVPSPPTPSPPQGSTPGGSTSGTTSPFANLPFGGSNLVDISPTFNDGMIFATHYGTLYEAIKSVKKDDPQGCWQNDVGIVEYYWDGSTGEWYAEINGDWHSWDVSSQTWIIAPFTPTIDSNTLMVVQMEIKNSFGTCNVDFSINPAQLPKASSLNHGENIIPVTLDLVKEVNNKQITLGEAISNLYPGCGSPVVDVLLGQNNQVSFMDVTTQSTMDDESVMTALRVMC